MRFLLTNVAGVKYEATVVTWLNRREGVAINSGVQYRAAKGLGIAGQISAIAGQAETKWSAGTNRTLVVVGAVQTRALITADPNPTDKNVFHSVLTLRITLSGYISTR